MDHLGTTAPVAPNIELVTSWINGKAEMKYSVRFEGKSQQEMLSSAAGHMEFLVANGSSRSLLLESSKPLRFQSLQGIMEFEKQTLRVLPSKFKAENRIYEVSGTVTLTDKQAKFKVSNGGSRWDITGPLDSPRIIAQPVTVQTTSARSR